MKFRKIMKTFLMGVCSLTLISTSNLLCLNVNSLEHGTLPVTNKVVDNDSLPGQGGMYREGFNTYFSNQNLYNGDARMQLTRDFGLYQWKFPESYSRSNQNLYATVSVYLDNSQFCDPSAYYEIENGTYLYSTIIGNLNQNLAPRGWSQFPRKTITPVLYVVGTRDSRASAINLETSRYPGNYYTGADAIRYTITT